MTRSTFFGLLFLLISGLSNAENIVIQSGKGSFNEQAIIALKKQDRSKLHSKAF